MNFSRVLSGWRSRAEVAAEVDEEIGFHLAISARDLRAAGLGEVEAERAAAERFGNVVGIRDRCIAIALQEQIMIQRINLVLIVVLSAVVGWGVYSDAAAQRRSAELLEGLGRRMDAMAAPVAARGDSTVYLTGYITRAGAYNLPAGEGLTVRRLLAAAGELQAGAERIAVLGTDGQVRGQLSMRDLADLMGKDIVLKPGDLVSVDSRLAD